MMFYAQSTSTVILGRDRDRQRQRGEGEKKNRYRMLHCLGQDPTAPSIPQDLTMQEMLLIQPLPGSIRIHLCRRFDFLMNMYLFSSVRLHVALFTCKQTTGGSNPPANELTKLKIIDIVIVSSSSLPCLLHRHHCPYHY